MTSSGEVVTFRGWPRLTWFTTDNLGKVSRDWNTPPRASDDDHAYVEYTTARDGSVMGVLNSRGSMLGHVQTLTVACNYTEGEVMVCVLDFKKDVGLWHGILAVSRHLMCTNYRSTQPHLELNFKIVCVYRVCSMACM